MESFQWGDNFVTGLTEVDNQHKYLVESINQFGNLLTQNSINPDDINQLHSQLAEYATYHFREEESMMQQVNIDPLHLGSHINEHNNFLSNIANIYAHISIENLDQARSFLKFLIHWLANHILCIDQDMARQISAINTGMPPRQAYQELSDNTKNPTEPLLEALTTLFEQVASQNKELQLLNDSLEEKVASRTKDLLKANHYLQELSLTDVLTGLPNRRHAMRYLASLWNESTQTKAPLVCMLIDADHFKNVNDTYGHDAGDVVLIELAKTLQRSLRNDDIVCRLGGDEFLVICPNTDKKGGLHIAELTRKAVAHLRVPTGDGFWNGSISIGVAHRSSEMEHYEDLIKEADKGVYIAKDNGRNCVKSAS